VAKESTIVLCFRVIDNRVKTKTLATLATTWCEGKEWGSEKEQCANAMIRRVVGFRAHCGMLILLLGIKLSLKQSLPLNRTMERGTARPGRYVRVSCPNTSVKYPLLHFVARILESSLILYRWSQPRRSKVERTARCAPSPRPRSKAVADTTVRA